MDTHVTTMHADPGTRPTAAIGGDPAPAVPGLAAHVAAHSKMRESTDIAKIAPALVRAQGAMENPPRNRSVQVRTQAGSYTFRYATLDKITDMTRHALAENGLCVLQPIVGTERGPTLVTRLLHESGQWMECEVLLPALGNNPQAFGSAVTYVRRYSVCALLNISADEDDDANRAAGNHYADVGAAGTAPRKATSSVSAKPVTGARAEERSHREAIPRWDSPRSGLKAGTGRQHEETAPTTAPNSAVGVAKTTPEDVARVLVNRARVAESVEGGHALLDAWQRDMAQIETLRGGKAWEALERELGAGLKHSLGVDPAAAFVAALRAADPQQVAVLQQHWEGKWADTLAAMQQEAPATYALLRRHVAAQIARVRGASGDGHGPHRGDEHSSHRGSGDATPVAPAFAAHLRDETGEVASDPITTPLAFAHAYADLWHATDANARTDLARHNAKALDQAVRDTAARGVLNVLTGSDEADATAGASPREDQRTAMARGRLALRRGRPRGRRRARAGTVEGKPRRGRRARARRPDPPRSGPSCVRAGRPSPCPTARRG